MENIHQPNQERPIFFDKDGTRVEQDAVVFGAGNDGRMLLAQFLQEFIRFFYIQRQQGGGLILAGHAAAPDGRLPSNDLALP
jgi:hypothetical protein